MARAIILVMDSFGIGASADATAYGDAGANTLLNIAKACARGEADTAQRQGLLDLPTLSAWGLNQALLASCGEAAPGLASPTAPLASFGYAIEQSVGKDTPSGHWEMAGLPVTFAWHCFPDTTPTFPQALITKWQRENDLPGVLGNCHASGTDILAQLGERHQQTGFPIIYTSADSVFQVAAHEESFGLSRLYEICLSARKLLDEYNVGRVIARPFVGTPGQYRRTANRRDYAVPPFAETLLDKLQQQQRTVIAVGKIGDIFAHRGMNTTLKAEDNMGLFDATLTALDSAPEGSLIFSNFVDFDAQYGHRRDVAGYAEALEAFDRRLPELVAKLKPEDLVIVSADHGCDPTFQGTDHTREHIPVLVYGPQHTPKALGGRNSFADIGQSIATQLSIPPLSHGTCFLRI